MYRVDAHQIRAGGLSNLDVLIHPGGTGGGQAKHLGRDGREAIRDFVRDGGGFVGICAGAYLATSHYDWSLDILDAKVLDTKHWNRGTGEVRIGITNAGQRLLKTEDLQIHVHYGQGPLLAPGDRSDIDDYKELATYETEIVENGAQKGVMIGATAAAQGRFGKGCVICFSPHPELTHGLENLLKSAIEHAVRQR